jgi:hypothetical protein
MPQQVLIGNFPKGLTLDRLPFVIDNDSFPYLYNCYVWRGRVKRKRGTIFLGRLQFQVQIATVPLPWQEASFALVAGGGNLIAQFGLPAAASITSKSLSLVVGANTYTDSLANGTLVGTPAGTGTINYATGAFTIAGGAASAVTGTFSYFPGLPVMGLEDLVSSTSPTPQYPLLLAFDTVNAYQIKQTATTIFFYNVSYYKATNNPVVWSGLDYQQFWTTNYSSAFWATNGKSGFHFVNGTYVSGSGTTMITFTFTSKTIPYSTLVIGDVLWFNEWPGGSTINGIMGTVSAITNAAAGTYVVTFAVLQTVSGTGIAQLLTNSIVGQDGIRWYDGDPTAGTGLPTTKAFGWVNFSPALTSTNVSINNIMPAGLYYLTGAVAILPFKDRILFFGPTIQTSTGPPVTLPLQDTVIWSWNGTPYYGIAPAGEGMDDTAFYIDESGKGGYLSAGIAQPIVTVSNNEDVLLIGFSSRAARFVYTSNDLSPFLFYSINSELGDTATFSGITLDKGAITIGSYGLFATTQVSKERIDLQIPDTIFSIKSLSNGVQRVNAVRDFYREWLYFNYPIVSSAWRFPTQTLLYNYRDETWAVLYENFTSHGSYRQQMSYTWATLPYRSWREWVEPWSSGFTTALFPSVVAGNPQGFVVIKGQGTGEARTGNVAAIADNAGNLQIVSIDHCVAIGDYLFFNNFIGTAGTAVNMQIGRVITVVDVDNFVVDIPYPAGTYLGLGTFSRLSQPKMQTKQFNPYWEQGRKVRIGLQKYLMDYTANAQVTVQIYLSQDPDDDWSQTSVVPSDQPYGTPVNNSLIYSEVMYTCPESANIGLAPANINLQMPTAEGQYQIWHRMNNSLIGDSFQMGITLSDAQMRNLDYATAEISLHAAQFLISEGPLLA